MFAKIIPLNLHDLSFIYLLFISFFFVYLCFILLITVANNRNVCFIAGTDKKF